MSIFCVGSRNLKLSLITINNNLHMKYNLEKIVISLNFLWLCVYNNLISNPLSSVTSMTGL